jgi:hypothetical protein
MAGVIAEWRRNAPADSGGAFYASEDGERFFIRAGTVADDFPSKAGAYFPKGARLGMAKHNGVLGVKGDDEVITVAPKCH